MGGGGWRWVVVGDQGWWVGDCGKWEGVTSRRHSGSVLSTLFGDRRVFPDVHSRSVTEFVYQSSK
ncbi:uncharacterized protein G2W53_037083 [Senna tora]|uniref:Uncharacterized protein n=1 Tax=Senna tora TaxID=362788 RepID=A0A834SU31_9FABA|nr:uncharacterized protein G2W53_037083 [Senna tora]